MMCHFEADAGDVGNTAEVDGPVVDYVEGSGVFEGQ